MNKVKFWLEDIRPAPEGYIHFFNAEDLFDEFLKRQFSWEPASTVVIEISLDNDLGEGLMEGYQLLDWFETMKIPVDFGIHIHTSNPVARERMRATIKRNGWKEVR